MSVRTITTTRYIAHCEWCSAEVDITDNTDYQFRVQVARWEWHQGETTHPPLPVGWVTDWDVRGEPSYCSQAHKDKADDKRQDEATARRIANV